MALSLVTAWFGTFLVDGGKLRDRRLFPQAPDAIAQRLATARAGGVLDEEADLSTVAGESLTVYEMRLASIGRVERETLLPPLPFDEKASGYPLRLLHDALLILAVREAHLSFSDRDRLVVHQVKALDEIVKSSNLLAERLREWYGVHAPEITGSVRDHADLARLVAEEPDRESVAAKLGGLVLSDLGVVPPAADEAIVRTFAHGLNTLYGTRDEIETRLKTVMAEVAPNLSGLVGPMVGARLIASAGGLEKLALFPCGTVQTLGAENALFRHLKDGSPPPKHGVLFQHEAVNRAPWWQRGKIARALSGKVSIAAKADAFGKDPTRGAALLAQFNVRLDIIQRQFPSPRRGPRPMHGERPPMAQGRPYGGGGGGGRGPPRDDRRGGGGFERPRERQGGPRRDRR